MHTCKHTNTDIRIMYTKNASRATLPQHTATPCNPIQHTAPHCNSTDSYQKGVAIFLTPSCQHNLLSPPTLYQGTNCQGIGKYCCSVLQCVAVCCSDLQCVLQCVAVCCSVLECVAVFVAVCCRVCCSDLQWLAVRSVLQSVLLWLAETCSVLQHADESSWCIG